MSIETIQAAIGIIAPVVVSAAALVRMGQVKEQVTTTLKRAVTVDDMAEWLNDYRLINSHTIPSFDEARERVRRRHASAGYTSLLLAACGFVLMLTILAAMWWKGKTGQP